MQDTYNTLSLSIPQGPGLLWGLVAQPNSSSSDPHVRVSRVFSYPGSGHLPLQTGR